MRILAVGGGAREHAIVAALVRSGAEVYACLKNRNPGIARSAKEFLLVDENDVDKVVAFARSKNIELAIVGPEAPLEAGLVDALQAAQVPTASPARSAAMIETSKSFMRRVLSEHRVSGAVRHKVVDTVRDLELAIDDLGLEVVVKPVGLTGGKGVKVFGEHMMNRQDIMDYGREVLSKKIGGSAKLVVEEKLVGEELTIQAFCDGKNLVPMPAVQDHKRAYEGDKGPNTGGMGSYSMSDGLLSFLGRKEYDSAVKIMKETVAALRKEGAEYRGTLYGQFMITKDGPKVIEFNARFGDPEAMNVLSLLKSDFVEICNRMAHGGLRAKHAVFDKKASVCKYVVPEGYGTKSLTDAEIVVDEEEISKEGALLYYASVNERDGRIFTTTSRSIGVVGISESIEDAERVVEKGISHISGRIHVRHDIAKREMLEAKVRRMENIRKGVR